MKKINILWNGEKLCHIYPHATRWQVFKWKVRRFMRKTLIISFSLGMIYGAFQIGVATSEGEITYAKEVIEVPRQASVLERIAKCESGNVHFDPKTGQVLMRANKNGTVDIGRFQINEYYWGKKATELGLNLTKEEDNQKMAEWIYENRGTEPWVHTKHCWNK